MQVLTLRVMADGLVEPSAIIYALGFQAGGVKAVPNSEAGITGGVPVGLPSCFYHERTPPQVCPPAVKPEATMPESE